MSNRILEILQEQGHTKYWLARETGIGDNTIGRYVNKGMDIDILKYGNVVRIAKVLGVCSEELRGNGQNIK